MVEDLNSVVIPGEHGGAVRGKGTQAYVCLRRGQSWVPFPSHCWRNAQPGMTIEFYENAASLFSNPAFTAGHSFARIEKYTESRK